MKSWFKRFRIANALDERRPLPPSLQDAIAQDAELRGAADDTATVLEALRSSPPELKTPAGLHSSIMSAVRSEAGAQPSPGILPWLRWLAAPAATALALAFLWHFALRPDPEPPRGTTASLAAAAAALELPHAIARDVPAEMLAPLSDELNRVNQDLNRTKEFLIASLP